MRSLSRAIKYAAQHYVVKGRGEIWHSRTGRQVKLTLIYSARGQYYKWSVRVGKRVYCVRVHRFIAYLKYGNKALWKRYLVRHLDDDWQNNSWGNIALGTHLQNRADMLRNAERRRKQETIRNDFDNYYTTLQRKLGYA